jgi:N-acetylmuramoyl-L-alanine amidase
VLQPALGGGFRTEVGHYPVPDADVLYAQHRITKGWAHWQKYPQVQIDEGIAIGKAICAAYGIKDIAGHEDIAPKRKVDPGAAYPLDKVIAQVLGNS